MFFKLILIKNIFIYLPIYLFIHSFIHYWGIQMLTVLVVIIYWYMKKKKYIM